MFCLFCQTVRLSLENRSQEKKRKGCCTFQSTVISSKENGNCNSTLSASTVSDQSWKDQLSPSGVVPREPTVHNITFSETETHIKKNISPLPSRTKLGKFWTILPPSLSEQRGAVEHSHWKCGIITSCFESAHAGCACSIYLLLLLWNQNNSLDNHQGLLSFCSSFRWKKTPNEYFHQYLAGYH